MRRLAACALAAALALPPGAAARSPTLKPADMKTIRHDARSKAVAFGNQYGARHSSSTCAKRTPYAARCRIRLIDVRAGTTDCAITLVYVVTPQHAIEGNVARDTCA